MAVDWDDDGTVRPTRRLALRTLRYFGPHKARGLLVIGCITVQSALGLAPALVFKSLIDYLAHPTRGYLPVLLLVIAGIGAVTIGGLIGVAQSYVSNLISQHIVAQVRREVFDSLIDQPVGFFTSTRAGDILSRLNNDVGGVESVVTDTVFGLVSNLLTGVATLVLMVGFSWPLTLFVLAMIPLVALPTRRAGRLTYQARVRTQDKMGQLSAYLQETLGISGILLLKAFGKQPAARAEFGRLNDELRQLEIRQGLVARWFRMLMNTLQNTGPALIMAFGGWLVVSGHTTVGTVFVFATVLGQRLAGAVSSLATLHVDVTGSLALFGRLFAYIDRPPEITDAPDAIDLGTVDGAVGLDAVTFTYPGADRPALDEVSVEIAPGELVALVGPSGAGKTTLTMLVPRFYDPQGGRVLVDGRDLRSVSLATLTRHIGIVFQDTFLFHASIAENLRYACPDATDADLVTAARAANLHEFVTSLPDGYNTVVGERGHRLSGGEKQRVAIARVILKDPRILILDEATSNLDTVSEQLIQAALRPLFTGRTSIVIAHRLSTVLAADRILVLDRGRLVEQGSHTDLLALGGLYATLYEHQFRPQPQHQNTATVA